MTHASIRAALVACALVSLTGCDNFDFGGTLGDPCNVEDDCAEDYSCAKCSIQSVCYFEDLLEDPSDFDYVCRQYGAGSPTDPRAGGGGTGGNCGAVWTCAYDGQATPMCQAACARSGSEREQTCRVLACFMESGDSGECCTVCSAICDQ